MRILLTTDTVGGVWTYAMELSRALAPAGVEVVLATMGPATDARQAREAAALSNVTVCESTWKLEWMPDPWPDVDAAGEWLLGLEGQFRPDVIHLNGYAHGALPWRAPVMVVGHSCVCSWWRAVKGEEAPGEWTEYRRRVRAGLAGADLVVAPSREMLRALRTHYGPLPASRVIYNGRDASLYTAARRKRPMILSAGRLWDEAKNLAALEAVAGDLDWPVYVAGDEQGPDGTRNRPRRTRPLGRLAAETLARWLGAASVYCLPAKYEPFGLSAVEAALSGCALVLGDIPSLREVWDNAAEFVPPEDTAALHDTLNAIARDPARRLELARRAHDRALRYTPRRMVDAYLSAYRHFVTHARPTALTGMRGAQEQFVHPA